jgi:hypothetical protein
MSTEPEKVPTEEKVTAQIPEEEQKLIDLNNKRKYAIDRIKEIKRLFKYLEDVHCGNRHQRKQFRRDFISLDNFSESLLDSVIEFYSKLELKNTNNA